jgi:hypothetical protein
MRILSWKLRYIWFWIILQALCIWIQCTLKRHQKVDKASRKCGLYQNIIIIYCFCHCPYHIIQSFAVLRRKNKWSNTIISGFFICHRENCNPLYANMPSMCLTSGTPIVTLSFYPEACEDLFFQILLANPQHKLCVQTYINKMYSCSYFSNLYQALYSASLGSKTTDFDM